MLGVVGDAARGWRVGTELLHVGREKPGKIAEGRGPGPQAAAGTWVLGTLVPADTRAPFTAGMSSLDPSSEPTSANAVPATWGAGKLHGRGGQTDFSN